jgi:hypothetical protein
MSVVNLLGNLITPQYPAVYLVSSSVMTEAVRYGRCSFDGVIGTLEEDSTTEVEIENEHLRLLNSITLEDSKTTGQLQVSVQELTTKSLEPSSTNDESVALDRNAVQRTSQDESRPLLICKESDSDPQSSRKARSVLYIPRDPFLSYYPRFGQAKPKIHIKGKKGGDVWMWRKGSDDNNGFMAFLFSILVIVIQIAIIGCLSRFHRGASTLAQRVWTMTWFSFGIIFGYFQYIGMSVNSDEPGIDGICGSSLVAFLLSAPAIGGLVVVGQMLIAFGSCVRFS